MSLASLLLSAWLFRGLVPGEQLFLPVVFALSLVSTLYYGWLPYFLPALFPTRVRATGSGVSFNFGRIFSAVAVFATAPLSQHFGGDAARMAAVTSLVFAAGLILAPLIPQEETLGGR
jgi:hypothetical protein